MSTTTFEVPLSGEPIYHNPAAGNDFIDARFAPLDSRGNGLKTFIETETARRAGKSRVILPGDIVADVAFNGEQWTCSFVFEGKRVRTLGRTRDDAVVNGARFVTNAFAKKEVRELTNEELAYTASLAQSGQLVPAIEYYLSCAITNKNVGAHAILSDSKYAEVCDAAAWYTWSRANNEYVLTDAKFPAFLETFGSGKRLTVELLNVAWKKYKEQDTRQVVASAFGETTHPKEIATRLEDASDEDIKQTFWSTAKHAARNRYTR